MKASLILAGLLIGAAAHAGLEVEIVPAKIAASAEKVQAEKAAATVAVKLPTDEEIKAASTDAKKLEEVLKRLRDAAAAVGSLFAWQATNTVAASISASATAVEETVVPRGGGVVLPGGGP